MHSSVLKYFVEVVRCGSVRKASESLFVASSAVNRQIIKLEQELGIELFDRFPGGMRVNAAGTRLLRHVQATLLDFQSVRADLEALKGEATGHIKIAAIDALFDDLMPTVVEEIAEIFPCATFTLTTAPPLEVMSLVASGHSDVGLTFIGRLSAGIEVISDFALPMGVMMSPGHSFAAQESVSLEACAQQPFLRFSHHQPMATSVCPEFGAFWDQLEAKATCNSAATLKRLVIAGYGISFFSKVGFLDELECGLLCWRPFSLPALRNQRFGILTQARRDLPGVTTEVISRLSRRLAQIEARASSL